MKKTKDRHLIALLTNNDDDIYCFRKELIEEIIGAGYEMLISCPNGEKFELMKHIEYRYDNPVIDRRGTNIIADAKLFIHYFRLFLKNKPSVVLTYTAKPNVYAGIAAYLLGIPVISNVTGFGSVLNEGGLKQKLIMSLFRFSFRRSACVMFQNSTNMKLAEESGMVKGEHKLIPGSGVNTDRYPLQPYPHGGNGKEGEKVVFNYIGRILHDKGVDDYIEAAKKIKAEYPNTEFNMLGFIEPTEMYYEKLLSGLEEKGIIKYRGSRKDIKPFVAASHATIHPSTYGEGMSNVLLESASSGRPIISTDNPGCMETFVDGETGFIYHGGDVDALCEQIIKFLALPNDERKTMGEKGREYIKANFSREKVIEAYLDKISALCK
ncbi:MAG: glycosyltransferase family 4 protein [Ruminococcaceae bacterium]|nr:glycosyltransferase family 4 protein [Oscillospiraceae bacterium]